MNIKPLIALVMLNTLVVSFSMQCFADKTASSISAEREIKKSQSSLSKKSAVDGNPNITNEAEYAEFVRQREEAGQASSVKQASKALSSESSRSKAAVK
jgi:hypothetical protein